jgi:hypothetical protein
MGFLPPVGGLPKTPDFFDYHRALINTGDIAYTLATTILAAGKNHLAWNFSASAEVVNDAFSQVVWSIPCRITPAKYDDFPYAQATEFIEKLTIPFTSVTESIQSSSYEYDSEFHRQLRPEVVRYLKVIGEKSRIVGTRGEYSADVLTKLGIKNVEPVGCPSLYINGRSLRPELLRKKPFADVKKVAVAYSNYQLNGHSLIHQMLATAAEQGYYFVEQTSNIVPKLMYYPDRLEAGDFLKANQLYGGLAALRSIYQQGHLRYFTNYQNWKSFLGEMDFVFGARMHGLTPAVQSGVPAHFIVHDSRVREMCEFFKLPFSSEQSFAATGFSAEALYGRTDYGELYARYPQLYCNFLRFLMANGIRPNCNAGLEIVNDVDFSPACGVEIELNPATDSAINRRFANEVFDIGESIVKQGSVEGYESHVKSCGQLWHAELQKSLPTQPAQPVSGNDASLPSATPAPANECILV